MIRFGWIRQVFDHADVLVYGQSSDVEAQFIDDKNLGYKQVKMSLVQVTVRLPCLTSMANTSGPLFYRSNSFAGDQLVLFDKPLCGDSLVGWYQISCGTTTPQTKYEIAKNSVLSEIDS